MTEEKTVNAAIMFADISDSTRLYEQLGDKVATELVNKTLDGMTQKAESNKGLLVKTIGDEVMLRFSSVESAIKTACEIQDNIYHISGNPKIKIRIGINFGSAIERSKDVFGDAVILAARVTGEAKAEQILITQGVVNELQTEHVSKVRRIDYLNLKGKSNKVAIYQYLWEAEETNQTLMFSSIDILQSQEPDVVMKVSYGDQERSVLPGRPLLIGRDHSCDIVVGSLHASRKHAQIMESRGKYVLIDKSTNGTHVKTLDGKAIYLRREQMTLLQDGVISLGEKIVGDNRHIISFSLQSANQTISTVINDNPFGEEEA